MIPTKTGAAKAVGEVIPELNGKLTGFAVRVPVPDGSMTDLTALLKKTVTKDEVNGAIKTASEGPLKGILEYNTDPIVSSDIIGNPHSCIFVPDQTLVIEGNLVKVIGWYDNEWGYSVRTAELIGKLGSLSRPPTANMRPGSGWAHAHPGPPVILRHEAGVLRCLNRRFATSTSRARRCWSASISTSRRPRTARLPTTAASAQHSRP